MSRSRVAACPSPRSVSVPGTPSTTTSPGDGSDTFSIAGVGRTKAVASLTSTSSESPSAMIRRTSRTRPSTGTPIARATIVTCAVSEPSSSTTPFSRRRSYSSSSAGRSGTFTRPSLRRCFKRRSRSSRTIGPSLSPNFSSSQRIASGPSPSTSRTVDCWMAIRLRSR